MRIWFRLETSPPAEVGLLSGQLFSPCLAVVPVAPACSRQRKEHPVSAEQRAFCSPTDRGSPRRSPSCCVAARAVSISGQRLMPRMGSDWTSFAATAVWRRKRGVYRVSDVALCVLARSAVDAGGAGGAGAVAGRWGWRCSCSAGRADSAVGWLVVCRELGLLAGEIGRVHCAAASCSAPTRWRSTCGEVGRLARTARRLPGCATAGCCCSGSRRRFAAASRSGTRRLPAGRRHSLRVCDRRAS